MKLLNFTCYAFKRGLKIGGLFVKSGKKLFQKDNQLLCDNLMSRFETNYLCHIRDIFRGNIPEARRDARQFCSLQGEKALVFSS